MTATRIRPNDADCRAVLVYDGECPFRSATPSALRRLPEVGTLSWYDEPAQRFLEAQFDATPFAMVLADIDERRVYVGPTAARELCERAGVPTLVPGLVGGTVESIDTAIGCTVESTESSGPRHGTYPLSDAAEARFETLAAAAEQSPLLFG